MDRMLVVVFDNASKAYEGAKVLQELDGDGSISVYSHAVVVKNPDDTTTVRQSDDRGPLGTLVGTLLGSLIGLLGGPTGFAIGGAVGLVGGAAADLNKARIGDDFIVDVAKVLLPNRAAVVAEIEEDSTTPVDTRMEAIGGTVFRRGSQRLNTRSMTRTLPPSKPILPRRRQSTPRLMRTEKPSSRKTSTSLNPSYKRGWRKTKTGVRRRSARPRLKPRYSRRRQQSPRPGRLRHTFSCIGSIEEAADAIQHQTGKNLWNRDWASL